MKSPTLRTKLFLKMLERAQHGRVTILFPDGIKRTFGTSERQAEVVINDWGVFDLLFRRGDLGLAEAIIEKRMVVSDVAALVEWACLNDQTLGSAFRGKWLSNLAERVTHLVARNNRTVARKNIVAHYDLGNEFYRLWLDRTMTYSSALFQNEQQPLEAAQAAKYDRIIDRLDIKSGDHVLEIGCGWGGFFTHLVEKTGCRVTAVMNSPEQARYNRQLIAESKMRAFVDLRELDYRDIEGRFDKIVSIEMIEAVGELYWPTFFKKLAASLKSGGKALIQGITIRDDLFYRYRKGTDFIQQYVFPGGMLLTEKTFREQGAKQRLYVSERFEFAESYAKTLQLWRENFERAIHDVREMGFDDRFIRMWRLYLSYCEGAFRARRIGVGQYLFEN